MTKKKLPTRQLSTPLTSLRNIGKYSAKRLTDSGIPNVETLRALGANQAYQKLKARDPSLSICMFYALVGALEDIHWLEVCRSMKENLDRVHR